MNHGARAPPCGRPGPCEAVKGPVGDGEIKERSSTGATLTGSDRREA